MHAGGFVHRRIIADIGLAWGAGGVVAGLGWGVYIRRVIHAGLCAWRGLGGCAGVGVVLGCAVGVAVGAGWGLSDAVVNRGGVHIGA